MENFISMTISLIFELNKTYNVLIKTKKQT